MRALVQRVTRAEVRVGGEVVGAVAAGLCAFVGVTHGDDEAAAGRLADRIRTLRVFPGPGGPFDRSVADVAGAVLVVSQFTLYGDTRRGRRPSWSAAAPPAVAAPLVEAVADRLRAAGTAVATGRFGAHMEVELVNDGPVTLALEA